MQVSDRMLAPGIERLVFANGFSGTADDDVATITLGPFTGRIETAGPKPGYTLLAPAGTTATASITGNDISGQIEVVPGGTGIATGSFITITFFTPYPSATFDVQITPNSSAARSLTTGIGPTSRSSTSFNLDTRTALTSGSTYQWGYLVIYRRANV
ncbi:MAG: hypothetical protein IT337_05425 [Thermomicrobiales bacterium]|nr:hypothetical protein [Thermomicrobiales bacterium]